MTDRATSSRITLAKLRVGQATYFYSALILFRLVLDYAYIEFVHPAFSTHFFAMLLEVEVWQYALSLLIFLLFLLCLRNYQHSVGNIFQLMAAIFVVAPLTSQYGLDASKPLAPVLVTVGALLLIRIISELRLFNRNNALLVKYGRKIIIAVSILAVVYLIVWTYLSGAVQDINFNPDLVYEFRDQVSEKLDIGLLGYVNLWVYKFFTIFLVCLCLKKKRFGLLIILLILQTYFAGITSHKLVFFLPFLAIGCWYYLSKTNNLYQIPLAATVIVAAALGTHLLWEVDIVSSMLIRRTFYVPSVATFEWFSYFSARPNVFWSDALLSSLIHTEYNSQKIPLVVGDHLYYGHDLAANNGLVSSGYAHASYLGVVLYSLLLGVILNIINYLAATGVPVWMAAALTIGPLRTAIADSDLLTTILSHGLLISVIILWLYRSKEARLDRE